MIYQLFTIRDSKGETATPPKASKTIGEAERMLELAVNNPKSEDLLALYPQDFDLWHLGTFDDQTMKIENFPEGARHIAKAIAYKKQ